MSDHFLGAFVTIATLRSPALTARKHLCGSLHLRLHKPHVAILMATWFAFAVFCSDHPLHTGCCTFYLPQSVSLDYTLHPAWFILFKLLYAQAKRRYGDDYLRKFNNLLSSLSWPPSFTTVRLNFPSIEDSSPFRELKRQLEEVLYTYLLMSLHFKLNCDYSRLWSISFQEDFIFNLTSSLPLCFI